MEKVTSNDLARAMVKRMVRDALIQMVELGAKPKLTAGELHALVRAKKIACMATKLGM